MKQNEVISSARLALQGHKAIFEESESSLCRNEVISSNPSLGLKYVDFYFPKKIPLDQVAGFGLKMNRGFISLFEKYKVGNRSELEKVSYIYRYVTSDTIYTCAQGTNQPSLMPYSFHYDMDLEYKSTWENDNHPKRHLQVLHTYPRYESHEMTMATFILFVKQICFTGTQAGTPFFLRK